MTNKNELEFDSNAISKYIADWLEKFGDEPSYGNVAQFQFSLDQIKLQKLVEERDQAREYERQRCNQIQDLKEENTELMSIVEIQENALRSCVGFEPFYGLEPHRASEAIEKLKLD